MSEFLHLETISKVWPLGTGILLNLSKQMVCHNPMDTERYMCKHAAWYPVSPMWNMHLSLHAGTGILLNLSEQIVCQSTQWTQSIVQANMQHGIQSTPCGTNIFHYASSHIELWQVAIMGCGITPRRKRSFIVRSINQNSHTVTME